MGLRNRKLLWKGTAVIAVTAATVLGLFFMFLSRYTSGVLMDRTREQGQFLLEAMGEAVFQGMIHQDSDSVHRAFLTLSSHKEIDQVALYNGRGELGRSSTSAVGLLAANGEAYRPDGRPTEFLITHPGGHRCLVVVRPVVNQAACRECHGDREGVLGSVGIEMSLAEVDRYLSLSRIIMLLSIGGLMTILTLVHLGFFKRLVVNPLESLNFKIREVERGGGEGVEFASEKGDEFSELEASFGEMVARLEDAHQDEKKREKDMALMVQDLKHQMELSAVNKQLADRVRDLDQANRKINRLAGRLEEKNVNLGKMVKRISTLNRLGVALSSELELERVVRLTVNVAVKGLRAEHGFLMLKDEEENVLRIAYGMGLGDEYDRQVHMQMGESIAGRVAETGEPMLIANMTEQDRFRKVSRYGFLRRSVVCGPLKAKERVLGVLELANKKGDEEFTREDLEMLASMCSQAAIAIENARLYQKVQKSYFDTVRALIQAVEEKDRYTRGHSERVTLFSLKIAEMMGLDQKRMDVLKYAGYLHDIGKISIDINILTKKGKLNDEEFNLVKHHPLIGERIIAPIDFLKNIRSCVSQHHERYDGFGYPAGINGREMELEARILAVADAYDAMITDRPYRQALPKGEAVAELRRCSGTQFDPEVVEVFTEVLETDREILDLEKSISSVGT